MLVEVVGPKGGRIWHTNNKQRAMSCVLRSYCGTCFDVLSNRCSDRLYILVVNFVSPWTNISKHGFIASSNSALDVTSEAQSEDQIPDP